MKYYRVTVQIKTQVSWSCSSVYFLNFTEQTSAFFFNFIYGNELETLQEVYLALEKSVELR